MNRTTKKQPPCRALVRLCLAAAMTGTSVIPFAPTIAAPATPPAEAIAVSQAKDVVKVDGVVLEKANGEILPGASVAIYRDGTLLTATSADIDGKFMLNVPKGEFEIRVSYIGMMTKVIPSKGKDMRNLKVFLEEDAHTIQDVVVTGYVNKNKETFTGSVTQIKGDELKMVSNTNILTAIAALTPGMSVVQNSSQGSNPNHVEELVLRGTSSFSNAGQDVNQPTIILDGTEITMQELYDLDMNEVETINVLKDASATALYGSKAANGVIVITRKPIKNSTVRVQYNFTGDLQFPKLGDYNLLNAAD